MENQDLKLKTARTLKWNTIDKFSSQVLYAITGIVLANVLSKSDFGLVGAILIFQSFATLFVDSGFSSALIQKKVPTQTDYSTVFFFNLGVSIFLYIILWFTAPFIDSLFHAGGRLIPLSRIMFLTFIINSTALVQTNRLMKIMNVRMIAISNVVGLTVSGAVGIWMALNGYGAWAIVWQSIVLAAIKSIMLWLSSSWMPTITFDFQALKSIFRVGVGIMSSSFLNVAFLNIYSFIIGTYYNLIQLGTYTQADKWSKMGIASLSQVFTASFLPVLSAFQDNEKEFARVMSKTNRFAGYTTFFSMGLLLVCAAPIFHTLFGTKWDEAIPMFQILVIRGIITIITSLYNNFILARGEARKFVYTEVVKDVVTIAAIVATIPFGITWLLWGQVIAGVVFYIFDVYLVCIVTGSSAKSLLQDLAPYVGLSIIALIPAWLMSFVIGNPILLLAVQAILATGIYYILNRVLKSKIQADVIEYAFGRFRKKAA